ncbi:MAG: prepilin-type N-terminal cleavage/methylation domain-containing protein [Candidatus Hydrogenedentes bacterium]|nr:prepilin-type N-terminal cleavage/methylation domain-containing protein [Candidatus Hydrogenedentota bacterium]
MPQRKAIAGSSCRSAARVPRAGFTLMELMVVIVLISMICAVAFPYLVPLIAYSELRASATGMGHYGDLAMAHAAMLQDKIVVRINLDTQEYHAVKWEVPPPEGTEGEEPEADMVAMLQEAKASGNLLDPAALAGSMPAGMNPREMAMSGAANVGGLFAEGTMPEGFDEQIMNQQLASKFDMMQRRSLEARAKNVKHESFLEEIGPLFDEEDKFVLDESNQPVEVLVDDPILASGTFEEGVRLIEVNIAGEPYTEGEVEIEVSPIGLMEKVGFYFVNDAEEYYTTVWDPRTNTGQAYEGLIPLDEV